MDILNGKKNMPEARAPADLRSRVDEASLLRMVITIAASILGSFIGSLPAAIGFLLCDRLVPILFMLIPMCICILIHVLGGCHRIRGLIVCAVFSALGLYFVAIVRRTAEYIVEYKMSFSNLPLVAVTQIGSIGIIKYIGFNPAYIIPLLFTALGVACSYMTLRRFGQD